MLGFALKPCHPSDRRAIKFILSYENSWTDYVVRAFHPKLTPQNFTLNNPHQLSFVADSCGLANDVWPTIEKKSNVDRFNEPTNNSAFNKKNHKISLIDWGWTNIGPQIFWAEKQYISPIIFTHFGLPQYTKAKRPWVGPFQL